jgi:hypothetical protein
VAHSKHFGAKASLRGERKGIEYHHLALTVYNKAELLLYPPSPANGPILASPTRPEEKENIYCVGR